MTATAKIKKADQVSRETRSKRQRVPTPVRHNHEERLVEPPIAREDAPTDAEHPQKSRLWYWQGLFHDTLDY